MRKRLKIAMLGHKRIPSREGGIEIVVEELAKRMVHSLNICGIQIKAQGPSAW